jgi:hypothetical protein
VCLDLLERSPTPKRTVEEREWESVSNLNMLKIPRFSCTPVLFACIWYLVRQHMCKLKPEIPIVNIESSNMCVDDLGAVFGGTQP